MKRKMRLMLVAFVAVAVAFVALPAAAEYDFGGETITIWDLGSFGDAQWVFEEGEILEGRLAEAEEKFNVNIELESDANVRERLLAGDSQNDIWLQPHFDFYANVADGVYYPISRVKGDMDEYLSGLHQLPRRAAEIFNFEGSTYGFGVEYQPPRMRLFRYNKEVIADYGLEDPYQLYEAGEWTWEKFEEYLEVLRDDLDGDGEYDQFGFPSGRFNGWFHPVYIPNSNGTATVRMNEEGRLVQNIDSDAYINAWDIMSQWVQDDLVGDADFGNQTAVFDIATVAWMPYGDLGFDYGIIPMPMGPDAEEHHFPLDFLNSWTLPANTAHPEGSVELIEFLYPTDIYEEWYSDYVESIAPNKESFDVMMDGFNDWPGTYADADPFYRELDMFYRDPMYGVFSGEETARAALESNAPEAQAHIDDIMGY